MQNLDVISWIKPGDLCVTRSLRGYKLDICKLGEVLLLTEVCVTNDVTDITAIKMSDQSLLSFKVLAAAQLSYVLRPLDTEGIYAAE